jgi:hypothetical protein
MAKDAVLDWLLEGDPAIRWQVLRDLRRASLEAQQKIRARFSEFA